MPLEQLTNPTDLPITYDEARRQLRILDDAHEEYIYECMHRATASCEAILGGALISRQYRLDLDSFPAGRIDLGMFPVQSIDSFVYDDTNNTETSLTLSTDYYQNLSGKYPFVSPVTSWESTYPDKPRSVRITFTAGYSNTDLIPADVKHAILIQVKQFFDFGNDWVQGIHATHMNTINQLLFQHKRLHV